VSDEHDEFQRLRLENAMRRFYATRRRSLRWWKHAREYVSLLRLVRKGLLRSQPAPKDWLPPHPPWSEQGWRYNTPDGKAPFRY